MAANIWRGDAAVVQQVSLLTVGGTAASGDFIQAIMNRKVIQYTLGGSDTLATAAAGLYALISASSFPEFGEVAWAYNTGDAFITGTSQDTTGAPFLVTTAVGGITGTTTLTASTPTAATGPNNYDDATNWTLGTVPTGSDSTVINGGEDLLYGGGAIAGNTIEIRGSFGGNVGLPERNTNGYYEYRNRYITLNSATVKIGEGDGTGSSRLLVKAIASSTWTVYNTSQRETATLPACDIDMTGNPTLINVAGGDVGLCMFDESTSRTVAAAGISSALGRLGIGRTVTVTSLDMDDGQVDAWGTVTAVTMGLGTYNQWDGTLTAITAYGGVSNLMHTGTVVTVTIRGQGSSNSPPVLDCTANNLARTFTNAEFTGGAGLRDPNKTITFTNPYSTDGASYANSDIGPRFSVQRS